MACKIVTKSNVLIMPQELFHGICLAEVVFYTQDEGRAILSTCAQQLPNGSPRVTKIIGSLTHRFMYLYINVLQRAPDADANDVESSPTGMIEDAVGGAGQALSFRYELCHWQTYSML